MRKSMSEKKRGPRKTGVATPPPTPKRLRPSIKYDTVNPSDYLRYTFPAACDDCTHFNPENESCTLGYNSLYHRRERQQQDYLLTGKMVLCRFLEID